MCLTIKPEAPQYAAREVYRSTAGKFLEAHSVPSFGELNHAYAMHTSSRAERDGEAFQLLWYQGSQYDLFAMSLLRLIETSPLRLRRHKATIALQFSLKDDAQRRTHGSSGQHATSTPDPGD